MTIQIIDAARVLTGHRTAYSPGSIVIDDRLLAWVGPTADLPARWLGGTARITLPGASVLPGLIDAHVHLTFDCTGQTSAGDPIESTQAVVDRIRAGSHALMRSGVTTVRDLGAPRHTTITPNPTPGPRMLTSGAPLTVPRGHCHFLGGVVSTISDIDRLVAENARRGASWIKVMVTGGWTAGGHSSPYSPQFTDTQLAAIVSAARAHHLPVAAHAHGTTGIRQAVDAGVDSIEHCTWMTPTGFHLDTGLVREIADRRILVCPTINHHARSATGRLPWSIRREHLTTMLAAEVQLIPGTDAGIPSTPPGRLADSLSIYTDLGYTPAGILELATRRAANALGIGHLTGTLTAGRSADLLAVPGNPTQNLQALTTPILVVTAGQIYRTDDIPHAQEDTCA